MKVIALAAQKGGAGKTTLTVHLAVLAAQEGNSVIAVDTDPQKSTGDWWRARDDDQPGLIEVTADKAPAVLDAARESKIDYVFIDSPPHSESTAYAVTRAADLVLIPSRPSILDLRAIGETTKLVQGEKVKAAIVLNSCPPVRGFGTPSIIREAQEALAAYGVPLCPVTITQRAAMAHSAIDGQSVFEYEPTGKAAKEIGKLWKWIKANG